jgi:hypothetical protein
MSGIWEFLMVLEKQKKRFFVCLFFWHDSAFNSFAKAKAVFIYIGFTANILFNQKYELEGQIMGNYCSVRTAFAFFLVYTS